MADEISETTIKIETIETWHRDIDTKIFSICFDKIDGYMTIGGYNQTIHNGEIAWTRMYGGKFYSIKANRLYINHEDSLLREDHFSKFYETGTIIDSGTTFTYLCNAVYSKLFSKVKEFCDKNSTNCAGELKSVPREPHKCYSYDHNLFPNITDFFNTFPVVSLGIEDITVDWEPKYYLFAWPEYPKEYCIGVYSNGGAGNVLGGNFMRGLDVIFDNTNKTIGFVSANCNPDFSINDTYSNFTDVGTGGRNPHIERKINYLILIAVLLVISFMMLATYICYRKTRSNKFVQFQDIEPYRF